MTVTGLSNAEYLISSVALSVDEYYVGVGESPGVWTGRWAENLELSGVVEADQLRALVDGKHPLTDLDLLAGSRPRSVLAFDLTFSCPKSVSLLWALGSEPVAEVVAAAHRQAVEVALAFLEERAALARVQSGGVRHRVGTGGWVVAGFVHRTSREGHLQLHSHCLVPNLLQRVGDGRHVALDAGPLFDWARAAGSVYQNQLQRALTTKLRVRWGPDHHNTREMEGFSKAQLRAFSKRSAQIEAELEAKGANYESAALRMRADDEASLATRTAKDRSLTPSLLTGRWQGEAGQVGLVTGADLDRAVCGHRSRLGAPGWDEVTAALVDPETGLCSRSARFTQADVVEHLCALSAGRLSVEEMVVMADRFVGSDLAVRLTPEVETGRARPAQWSTAAHRALEDRTLALMATLAARSSAAVTPSATEAALDAAPDLGEDQVAAVRVLAGEGGSLRAVRTAPPTCPTPGPGPSTAPRAAPGRPATCWAARRWTPTGVIRASPAPAGPPTPGTRPGWWPTTAGPWLTSGTGPPRSPMPSAANPTPLWPPAATRGWLTASCGSLWPTTNGPCRPGRPTARTHWRPPLTRWVRPRPGWKTWTPSPLTAHASSTNWAGWPA